MPTGDDAPEALQAAAWGVVRSPEDLGAFVARLRYANNLTQDELAQRLGISRRYVYEIESGKPNLYALRLFEILNLPNATMTVAHDPNHGSWPTPSSVHRQINETDHD
ncbi:hypothetical protein GCM10022223_06320 [Kineosporia mesophila]|uniref:HTH cro/C1-type domain-containing protein n=1 Tax=Kineosporia mesophila TaxID=566012 RepID=A0ABP6Z3V5_9ACTN|nr:helix-turn-helix domain-containing protein [Kineosporia mesophila]MCD5351013.1 helix-turn-helix domain-containing protein [Kineosporia mesophila]